MSKLRIVAAVLDTRQLTLYHEDGQTTVLLQGDRRIRPILEQHTAALTAGQVIELDIADFNHYAAFEAKTSGLVKLFRVAKKMVGHLLGSDAEREIIEPMEAGQVPKAPDMQIQKVEKPTLAQDIDTIMAHAKPVSAPDYRESDTTDEHTIVALVQTPAGRTAVVPGVEALKDQMAHSAKLGSTQGVEKLISRLGAVIADKGRGHSVQDVLRFLERGDLPVADDGDIIGYKILKRHPTIPDSFVDCHTKRVVQRVGSYVCVDEALVDRNRRNECSNGLHVARRGYLGNFSGDVCVLIRMAPEDVVTVPHNDPNKVRVCGYHIIGLIPPGDFTKLKQNQPMSDTVTQQLVGQAIAGKSIARLEQVKITGQQGQGVVVTRLVHGKAKPLAVAQAQQSLQTAPAAKAIDDPSLVPDKSPDKPVDPKQVNQQVKALKAVAGEGPRQLKAKALIALVEDISLLGANRLVAAKELVAHKKAVKVSYLALGLSQAQVNTLNYVLEEGDRLKTAPAAKPMRIPRDNAGKQAIKTASKPVEKPLSVSAPKPAVAPTGGRMQIAKGLALTMCDTTNHTNVRKEAAQGLILLKKRVKVSWETLGLTEREISEIKALLG